MLKNLVSKKTKAVIAGCAIAALLMTNGAPVAAVNLLQSSQETKATVQKTNYRNVMYYGDWSVWGGQKNFYPQDIPADQLTHLNFAFMDFDANGDLVFTDELASVTHALGYGEDVLLAGAANAGILNGFRALKTKNPNLKIGVSVGGWSMCGEFTSVCKDDKKRANLVQNLMDFIKYTNMDFVDIDWEYPTAKRDGDKCDNHRDEGTPDGCPEDREYFIWLMEDLRAALDKQGKELGKTYELSAALPAPIKKVEDGINVKRLFELVDFANIMTYDMRGAWDTISGHQTGLYTNPNDPMKGLGLSIDESVKYYMDEGAPAEKIVIGAAFYTRGWEKVSNNGTDSKCPGLFGDAEVCATDANGDPTPGALPEIPLKDGEGGRRTGVWSYNALDELKAKYPGLNEYWDDVAKAPYLYSPSTGAFFTYDNVRSIQEKCKYVKENNLGGVISWMASMDKSTDNSSVRDELTKTIKEGLYGSEDLPDYPDTSTKLDISASLEVGKVDQLCTGKGKLVLKITNNEKITTKGDVLNAVETSGKTVMNGRIYIETDGVEIIGAQYPLSASSVKQENGKYYIDLSETYSDKMIKPGETKTYNLDVKDALSNLDGIISVSLKQRVYPITPFFGQQTLYGYDSSLEEVDQNGNYLPRLEGLRSKKVIYGTTFNPLDGIKAIDKEDGDITSKIKVTGSVNTLELGEYKLTYSVTDSNGATTTVPVVITVDYETRVKEDNYDPTKDYKYGDRVIYQGVEYEYLFNGVINIKPGEHEGIWKTIGPAIEVIKPDIVNLASVAAKYNAKKGDSKYDSQFDLNSDEIIDLYDLVIVAKKM